MEQTYRFQLLAPSSEVTFGRAEVNGQLYRKQLAAVRKLRGRVYAGSGAVRPEELEDGCFPMRGDEQSWHLLLIEGEETVAGCARYRVHPQTVALEQLRILDAAPPVASPRDPDPYEAARRALENHLNEARAAKLSFVEVGGWALAEAWRGTRAALEILLACYALGELWGGSLLVSLATIRQGSSSVLRRIGGSGLELHGQPLPALRDPRYIKDVELLTFDTRSLSTRFRPLVSHLVRKLSDCPILRAETTRKSELSDCELALGAAAS